MRDILRPSIVLFLICILTTAALAGTYSVTKDIIAERAESDASVIRSEVLPDSDRFHKINDAPDNVIDAYEGIKGEKKTGYVFTAEAKGYGGPVIVMVGISTDGAVKAAKVLSASETPGLGAKIFQESFVGAFSGEIPLNGYRVVKSAPALKGDISAITGATISSAAVVNAVNKAITAYSKITGKGGMPNVKQ